MAVALQAETQRAHCGPRPWTHIVDDVASSYPTRLSRLKDSIEELSQVKPSASAVVVVDQFTLTPSEWTQGKRCCGTSHGTVKE